MKFTTFISSLEDLNEITNSKGSCEVLIEPSILSREGKISLSQAQSLAKNAQELKISPILVWDILMTENNFQECIAALKNINLDIFSSIRIQCVGAATWLKENFPNIKIQLIAETGCNNLLALQTWQECFAPNLERIILNIQVPEVRLCEYIKTLTVPCEILGAGRILLFYSKRELLKPNLLDFAYGKDSEELDENIIASKRIEALVSSSDSDHRPFPVTDNRHGTLMYLDKDQFILHKLKKLKAAGIYSVRVDMRGLSNNTLRSAEGFANISEDLDFIYNRKNPPEETTLRSKDLKKKWPRKTIAPFFKSNLTTKQFAKLKAPIKTRKDSETLAEVVSCEKGKVMALYTLKDFSSSQKFSLLVPKNEVQVCENLEFKDISGNILANCKANKLILTRWIKGATPGSLLKSFE